MMECLNYLAQSAGYDACEVVWFYNSLCFVRLSHEIEKVGRDPGNGVMDSNLNILWSI